MGEGDRILRFRIAERHMHWAVAVPFMVCYTTALILIVVYNPDPTRPFRQVFSWTHRISGVCLFILPAWKLVRYWRDASLHLHNVRQVWRWSWDDVRWLCLIGPASVMQMALPRQGKFNAGEKINFMVLSSTYPIYLCTGLLIWFDASPYLSWLVHFSLAAIATPLLLGHIFMATVNPDTRAGLQGMITGFVDRKWARHHYELWYEEHFGAQRDGERGRDRIPERPRPRPKPPARALPRRVRPLPQPALARSVALRGVSFPSPAYARAMQALASSRTRR